MGEFYTDEYMRVLANDGFQTNYSMQQKFGFNDDINGTFEDIWSTGGNMTYLTSASTMTVTSTGNDTVGGTGARYITIEGLDGDYKEISERVELDSTTPQVTSQSFLRVQRAYVQEVGTLGQNENLISITATTGGSVQADIEAGDGQTEKTHYTVPAGYKAYVYQWLSSGSRGEDIELQFRFRLPNESWRIAHRVYIFENSTHESVEVRIPEKSDICIQGRSLTGLNNSVISSFKFLLLRNTYL